ncbi:MAG: helix-turn-helix domain-containing protein, partial [Planctomycetia bacterium]
MAAAPFAEALCAARAAAGLSQADLARRAGLTPAYVSLLESGRRRPPRPPVVERLARALGNAPGPLLELAALERTPDPIRRRLQGLDRERDRLGQARDRVLSTTLFHLARHPQALADLAVSNDATDWLRSTITRVGPRLRAARNAREARDVGREALAPLPAPERERLLEALPEVLESVPAAAAPT